MKEQWEQDLQPHFSDTDLSLKLSQPNPVEICSLYLLDQGETCQDQT